MVIVIVSLPLIVPVLMQILPPLVAKGVKDEPRIVQLVIVLFVASLLNCMVEVLAVAATLKLEIVNEFPAVFTPFRNNYFNSFWKTTHS